MVAASEPIAAADTPLNIVLGIGVLLLFAGVLIRALARQHRALARMTPLHELVRAVARRAASPKFRPRPASAGPDSAEASPSPAPTRPWPHFLEAAAGQPADAAGQQTHVDGANPKPDEARPGVPEPEATRLRWASLECLGRSLDESRRLHAAENRVAEELAALPKDSWLVERDVHIGARRIPFLVIGATGVFAIGPTDGAWNLRDLRVLSELGEHLRRQLPGYGPVHAAVCLAFDEMKPRSWYGGQDERGRGGWVLGLDWLHSWMLSFGLDQGLRESDIRRLDEAAGPFWDRRSTARLPATLNIG